MRYLISIISIFSVAAFHRTIIPRFVPSSVTLKMAEITTAMVKTLRDKSGAGMMDCKKALAESGGDIEGYNYIKALISIHYIMFE